MVVRIRLSSGIRVRQKRRKNQRLALAIASLLTPAAVMACVLAFWRLAADVNATAQFPIPTGLFSHWQVWLTLAVSLQCCATLLNRYGKPQSMFPKSIIQPKLESQNDHPAPKLANSRY
jgi:hypothetical protein